LPASARITAGHRCVINDAFNFESDSNRFNATSNPYLSALSGDTLIAHSSEEGPLQFRYFLAEPGSLGAWQPFETEAIEKAFQQFSNVINVDFVISDIKDADLVINKSDLEFYYINDFSTRPELVGGATYVPGTSYRNAFFTTNATAWWNETSLQPGGNSFSTLIHEVGHALGLAHPHDDNHGTTVFPGIDIKSEGYNPAADRGDHDLNQGIWTMMSYNDGWNGEGDASTPMALDVAVLQAKYGARAEVPNSSGNYNNTYALPTATSSGGYQCLYDTKGTNTISALGSATAVVIDLRPAELVGEHAGGYVSYIEGVHKGYTIASGSVFQVANGGMGDDHLIGNTGANTLNGGTGADVMTGGDGSDTYYIDNLFDSVIETNALGTGGIDTVYSYLTAYTLGTNVEYGRISTTVAANLTGNTLNNVLHAGAGNNVLNGGTGTDTASYLYATAAVTVSLALPGPQVTVGSGSDTLTSIEKLTGSSFGDTLTGNSAANTLNGGLGNDILTGGAGADFIRFDTLLNAASNRDTITDFSVTDDTLQLENAIFGSLTTIGTLAAGSFHSGAGFTSAGDANDYVIYNTTTGALYYDAGGNTGAAAVQFATLTGAPALTNLDFMVT
jgi:Ca2+-binding RTX toxin-like protein